MNTVAARFGNDAGGGAARAAIFGGSVQRQDAKFGNGIDRHADGKSAIDIVAVGDAVEQITIRFGPLAIHRIGLIRTRQTTGFS